MSGALSDRRIAFIGGGTMAEAIVRGLLSHEELAPEQIIASDPIESRRDYLHKSLNIDTTALNAEAVDGCDMVVFAVKPQVLDQVLNSLQGRVDAQALVLSIVAGAQIARYQGALNAPAVVRIMPNTPGQVGEGASVWTATPDVTEEQKAQARQLVNALGVEIYVEKESYLDMATALSGSGPAYVFLFIEALTDAGVQMGFSRDIAAKLALQTVRGSAIYAQEANLHPAILRNLVTSPGGTTAAALYEFEKGGFRGLIARAVVAAYEKARDLGEMS